MKAQPNVSPEQLALLRAEDEQLRPLLESEMPAVREEWRQYVKSLTGLGSRHSNSCGVPRAYEQRKLCHCFGVRGEAVLLVCQSRKGTASPRTPKQWHIRSCS